MVKRILAWVSLIGFILLILNLLVFRVQPSLSAALYMVIVVIFMLTSRRKDSDNSSNSSDSSNT